MKVYKNKGQAIFTCPDNHSLVTFVWQEGSEHAEHHKKELTCHCGKPLVFKEGTDPFNHPFKEMDGTPHNG